MNENEVFEELIPTVEPFLKSFLGDIEITKNPFIQDSKEQVYKVINLVNEPKLKFEIQDKELIILIEGQEGKFFRIILDEEAVSQIKELVK